MEVEELVVAVVPEAGAQGLGKGALFSVPAGVVDPIKGSLAPNFTLKLSLETFPMCCAYIITMNYL